MKLIWQQYFWKNKKPEIISKLNFEYTMAYFLIYATRLFHHNMFSIL